MTQIKILFIVQSDTKVTEFQKDKLLSLVQANFVQVVGRYTGPEGVQYKKRLWTRFANELNGLGPSRTGKEWKIVSLFISNCNIWLIVKWFEF